MEFVVAAIAGLLGGVVSNIVRNRRRKLEYGWKCPECVRFIVDSNDLEVVWAVMDGHKKEFHPAG